MGKIFHEKSQKHYGEQIFVEKISGKKIAVQKANMMVKERVMPEINLKDIKRSVVALERALPIADYNSYTFIWKSEIEDYSREINRRKQITIGSAPLTRIFDT